MVGTCRFCKKFDDNLIAYGPRHYAHPACYLDAGKKLLALRPYQVGQFPYKLLKERGLLDEAARLTTKKEKSA